MSLESINQLKLSDVLPMMPPLPPDTDNETGEKLFTFRKNIFQRRVDKVNEYMFDFHEIWPSAKPIELFIALEQANDDINLVTQKIQDSQFLRQISLTLSSHGIGNSMPRKKRSDFKYDFDDDDEEDEDLVKWSFKEIELLKSLTKEHGTKFSEISRYFKGKNARMCKKMYDQIKLEIRNENKKSQSKTRKKRFNIESVTFVKDGSRFTVGQHFLKFSEKESLNPIPGSIDQLTLQPMRLPTLSPDGYVLDYDTWMKLLKEQKVNPFTQNHIKSMRELIILTIDNFDSYKDKIVNLEQIKSND
ncbi:hypothetical protein M9Y10_021612 [Tritrichomonas musculus]|uniref:Myb-like domain-containing protein n=1 Tax=Tritrichomonas musculus TaxID=1915356 RepID=A0ABR2KR12_9EUKA